jgi:hypothetical protein
VVLLDEAMFVIGGDRTRVPPHRLGEIPAPRSPGQALILRHVIDAGGAVRFEIFAGADKVASRRQSAAAAS